MDKKKIIIITAAATCLLLLIAAVWGLTRSTGDIQDKTDKKEIGTTAKDFATAWYNYTKQTDRAYLASLRPYMTNSFFEATEYVNTSRPQDFEGQKPMSSTVKEVEILTYDGVTSNVMVTISTKEDGGRAVERSVQVTLEKINAGWLVSQLEIPTG